jgi:hypothetical protein
MATPPIASARLDSAPARLARDKGRSPLGETLNRHPAGIRLREQLVLTRETSLVHGPYRAMGLRGAGLLPFNT